MITRNFRRMVEAVVRTMHDAFLPAGTIVATGRTVMPSGWLFCDGTAYNRITYANLFAAIGTGYGSGDGSTTFNVPNMKGRVAVCWDSTQTEFDAVGETGGAKTHQLTATEMPAHTHGHNVSTGSDNGSPYYPGGITARNSTANLGNSGPTTSTGSDGAHNNLQPYIVVLYMIKY